MLFNRYSYQQTITTVGREAEVKAHLFFLATKIIIFAGVIHDAYGFHAITSEEGYLGAKHSIWNIVSLVRPLFQQVESQ